MDFWETLAFGLTDFFIASAFFLFLHFINKLIRLKKAIKEFFPLLGLTLFFLSLAVGILAINWYDYYRWELGIEIFGLYKFYALTMVSSFASVAFLDEYILKKTHYAITIYLIIGIIFIAFLNNMPDLIFYPKIIYMPLFVLIPPMWYFTFIKPLIGRLRMRMTIALAGFFLLALSFAGRTQFFINLFGIPFYSFATLCFIGSLCLMGFGFSALSTFSDFRWKEKLREFFAISTVGLCLYAFSFEKNRTIEDSDLIAGGFSGIQTMLSEIVKTSDSLQLIAYHDIKIMVEKGNDVLFVLILKEGSSFIQEKLKLFAKEFDFFFSDTLSNWKGDLSIFKPINGIVQKIFLEKT